MPNTLPHPVIKPWYKQFWPWFLITLPAIAVVASTYTFVLAIRSNDGLVSDDYYKQGEAIDQVLDRDREALRLGIKAQFMLGENHRDVRVLLSKPLASAPPTLTLSIMHPTQAGHDQIVQLKAEGPQMYAGQLATPLMQPHWDIELGDPGKQWRLRGIWQLNAGPLQLPAN